jgi:hypothetical protein
MLFWSAGLALFFFSDKIFPGNKLSGPPLISLPFIALLLLLGWVLYYRGQAKVSAGEEVTARCLIGYAAEKGGAASREIPNGK